MNMRPIIFCFLPLLFTLHAFAQPGTPREYGVRIGVLSPGPTNSIIDIDGVRVGHTTLAWGDSVNTGATAILPHGGNIFQEKVPAAIFVGNGFGKLAGSTQVAELGNIESPIILTNTLSVASALDAVITHTLTQPGNERVLSVNAVVGETNDGYLNDIRGRHVQPFHVLDAIAAADSRRPTEGNVGAGTGTVCFGFKGGIGTSSRQLPAALGGYTVGVIVQTNFGGVLEINGAPIGKALGRFSFSNHLLNNADGSCMVVLATDAPLNSRSLERLAKRAFMGLAKTGGIASNGSGDYVIAFSTDPDMRIAHETPVDPVNRAELVNDKLSPLFMAAIEATEEAIINSLFAAETLKGKDGNTAYALPLETVIPLLRDYGVIPRESSEPLDTIPQ